MSTLGQLIDRTYREYLRPVEEQEPLTQVANLDSITGGQGLTSTGTTLQYKEGLFTPEEEELIGAGSVLEIDTELVMVEDINTVSREITIERGRLGSTAAEHLEDTDIILKPKYPRLNVTNAIGDQVIGLFPALYAVKKTTLTTSSTQFVEMPAGTQRILQAKIDNSTTGGTTTSFTDVPLELLTDFAGSTTDAAVQFPTSPTSGKSVYVVYASKFTRPTAETDNLNTISGLEDFHEQIVMVGAVAQLLSELDVDASTQNYITENLEQRGVPVGSGERLRNALLRYYGVLLDRARREQRSRFPQGVELYGISFT
mgnify:FL=1|jgi:hypothetical protein|tara:strand:- start:613 stop:1554 length:942 start_codon:yes stop_codon:yes gene_type:complete